MARTDYYAVLGVTREASEDEASEDEASEDQAPDEAA